MDFFDPAIWGLFFNSFLAATVLPVGSEPYLAGLILTDYPPIQCLVYASIGNTLGGITSFYFGRLGKWDWIEKYLKIKREKVESFSARVNRFGIWTALLTWLPFIGDPIAVALGFFRVKAIPVFILMFIGKTLRYAGLIYLVLQSAS